MSDNMYDTIVNKLGFEPKDYSHESCHTENDNIENPFEVLSIDELRYLQINNYFWDREKTVQ